jgi:hypothetical protein
MKDRPPIFEADALHEALEDFAWAVPSQWTETQVITLPTTASVPDVHDDMARELAFYSSAKKASEDAIARFEDADVPWQRPPDYYAESVKSDGHMAKVKQQLMFEQQAIEQAEQRYARRISMDQTLSCSSVVHCCMHLTVQARPVCYLCSHAWKCGHGSTSCARSSWR